MIRLYSTVVALVMMLVLFLAPVSISAQDKVNINTASAEELSTLQGIGPSLADRIIEHRERFPFESPEDIIQVQGIGQATLDNISDSISVK